MIRVYSNESSLIVNHMKNILESRAISSCIKNETMQGIGIGELGMCWPELWIKDNSQQNEAEILIKDAISNLETSGEDWSCENCAEVNESAFNICWNCSQSKNID